MVEILGKEEELQLQRPKGLENVVFAYRRENDTSCYNNNFASY